MQNQQLTSTSTGAYLVFLDYLRCSSINRRLVRLERRCYEDRVDKDLLFRDSEPVLHPHVVPQRSPDNDADRASTQRTENGSHDGNFRETSAFFRTLFRSRNLSANVPLFS